VAKGHPQKSHISQGSGRSNRQRTIAVEGNEAEKQKIANKSKISNKKSGVTLLFLAVGLVNIGLVPVDDLLALQLLSSGHITLVMMLAVEPLFLRSGTTYVLWGPLLVGQNNAANYLNASQATSTAGALELLQNEALKLLIVHERVHGVTLDAILASDLLQGHFHRHNNSDGLVMVLGSVDADVTHDGA